MITGIPHGQYGGLEYYGCVRCQKYHAPCDEEFEAHKGFQSKHGIQRIAVSTHEKYCQHGVEACRQRRGMATAKTPDGEMIDCEVLSPVEQEVL